jgi:pimeloyl-ACP methyl ester carboxylesterase
MPKVKIGDIKMYCEDRGKGDPLVLLPGYGVDSTCFFRQIPGLEENYRVIAIDNRGTGISDKPDIPYSMEMMAKDVAMVLAALGIRKAHIYGHSMGGNIAQHLALCYPERTASLILACTTCGGSHRVRADQASTDAMFDPKGTPEERAMRLLPFVFSQEFISNNMDVIQQFGLLYLKNYPPPHVFKRQQEAMNMLDTYDRLPEIRVPTLVITGEADQIVPPGNSRILASKIPGSESITLQGLGHFLPMEAPEALNRAIHDFLKRHPIAA